MRLLALDTTATACSVALLCGDQVLEAELTDPAQHTRTLPALVASVLAQAGCRIAELDGVACGIGPGSFTSLRVGVAYAQGMAMGAGCRIVGLSSLAMLAHSAGPGRWVAALDARMGELYVGAYTVSTRGLPSRWNASPMNGSEKPAHAPVLADAAWDLVGNGWALYEEALRRALRHRRRRIGVMPVSCTHATRWHSHAGVSPPARPSARSIYAPIMCASGSP